MTGTIDLENETVQLLDLMVAEGRFASREQGIREAVHLLHAELIDQEVDLSSLDPETRQAVQEGLDDVQEGRTEEADVVFARLRDRYVNWSRAAE